MIEDTPAAIPGDLRGVSVGTASPAAGRGVARQAAEVPGRAGVAALAALLAFVVGWWTVALLVVTIGWTIWRLTETGAPSAKDQPERELEPDTAWSLEQRFAMLLVVVGLLLTLVTEFAFIRDTLATG